MGVGRHGVAAVTVKSRDTAASRRAGQPRTVDPAFMGTCAGWSDVARRPGDQLGDGRSAAELLEGLGRVEGGGTKYVLVAAGVERGDLLLSLLGVVVELDRVPVRVLVVHRHRGAVVEADHRHDR